MKSSKLTILSLVLVLSLCISPTFAYGPKKAGSGLPPIGVLVKELNLTPEQKDQLVELYSQTQKELINIRTQNKIARIDLMNEMMKDNPDEDVLNNLIDKIGENAKKAFGVRINRQLEIKKILTPEQQEKLKELLMKRKWKKGPKKGFKRGPKPANFRGGMKHRRARL